MASQRIIVQLPPELVEKVDRCRGDVSRSLWVRRAVERALERAMIREEIPAHPAPAEQPERRVDPGLAVEVARQAERDYPPSTFNVRPARELLAATKLATRAWDGHNESAREFLGPYDPLGKKK